jgi:sugar phosphate isomerase/epimerase
LGHAHINGWRIESLLPALGKRLHALHIHDNDGTGDAHAPIGAGGIDWEKTLSAAAATGRDLNLVLEYNIGIDPALLAEGKAFLEKAMARLAAPSVV